MLFPSTAGTCRYLSELAGRIARTKTRNATGKLVRQLLVSWLTKLCSREWCQKRPEERRWKTRVDGARRGSRITSPLLGLENTGRRALSQQIDFRRVGRGIAHLNHSHVQRPILYVCEQLNIVLGIARYYGAQV